MRTNKSPPGFETAVPLNWSTAHKSLTSYSLKVVGVVGQVVLDGRVADAERVGVRRIARGNVTDRRLLVVLGIASAELGPVLDRSIIEVAGDDLGRHDARRRVFRARAASLTERDEARANQCHGE